MVVFKSNFKAVCDPTQQDFCNYCLIVHHHTDIIESAAPSLQAGRKCKHVNKIVP